MSSSYLDQVLQYEVDPAFRKRARLICEWMEKIGDKPGIKILDLGCGRGFYSELLGRLHPKWQIIGIDAKEEYLDQARNRTNIVNVKYEIGDANKLKFKNDYFDGVVVSELLEHVESDTRVMKEINRVLKRKGIVAASVPHSPYPFLWDPINWLLEKFTGRHVPKNIWWLAGIWADHERLYNEKEWREKFVEAGFKIGQIVRSTKYCFPAAHFILYAIGKNLVEKGMVKSFNRFTDPNKKSKLMTYAIKLFNLPDKLNDNKEIKESDAYMNLVGYFIKP